MLNLKYPGKCPREKLNGKDDFGKKAISFDFLMKKEGSSGSDQTVVGRGKGEEGR